MILHEAKFGMKPSKYVMVCMIWHDARLGMMPDLQTCRSVHDLA